MNNAAGTALIPELLEGCVHVWRAGTGDRTELEKAAFPILNDEELERLGRYRFAEDRARFAVGRAGLRLLLGGYAGIEPSAVKLVSTPYGRPVAAPDSAAAGVEFSVSHAGGCVLLAFARGLAVGVDIECPRPRLDIESLVRRFFAPREVEAFASMGANRRASAFLAVWTRKEAFIKALGQGLSCPLASFAVTVEPDRPPQLTEAPAGVRPGEWSLRDIDAGPGCRAALAVRHPSPKVSLHEFAGLRAL
jgi:4'-phosphopantetheinyl transferase